LGESKLTSKPGNCPFVPRIPITVQADDRKRTNTVPKHILERFSNGRQIQNLDLFALGRDPTGDLDNRTAEAVFELISRLHTDYRLTSLIVTHNLAFARRCHRALVLHGGRVEEVQPASLAP